MQKVKFQLRYHGHMSKHGKAPWALLLHALTQHGFLIPRTTASAQPCITAPQSLRPPFPGRIHPGSSSGQAGRVTGSVMVFPCGETLTTSLIVSLLLSLRLMPRKNGRCERPARSHVFIHCSTAVRQAPRLTPSFCLLPFIWFFCAHHVDQGSNEAWAEKEVPRVSPNSPGRKAPGGLWKGLTPGAQPLTPGTDYIFMLG